MALTGRFKREAEATAEEVRAELAVSNIEAIDPFALLQDLEIPSMQLGQLAAVAGDNHELDDAVTFLQTEETSSLSAMTVFAGRRRLVVFNESHSPERRSSDLCHEASHALLMHEPSVAIDGRGCRSWNGLIEEEAQFLAGALLVPGKGARYAAKAGWSHETMARRFGCSVEMARWRDNVSGGRRLRRRG